MELRAKCIEVRENHVVNTSETEQMGQPEPRAIVYGPVFLWGSHLCGYALPFTVFLSGTKH